MAYPFPLFFFLYYFENKESMEKERKKKETRKDSMDEITTEILPIIKKEKLK